MKLFRYLLAIVFSTVVIASCGNEEAKESKAILAGDSEITLPATETTKAVTIYADGTWTADVTDTCPIYIKIPTRYLLQRQGVGDPLLLRDR